MSYPSYESVYERDLKVGDKTINIKVGKFSEQASAAVLASMGETVVHTTVALGSKVDWGYFPLHVEYVEKLYAGGVIKGSRWVKREGKPSDEAVLKARIIDRTIRPLFPEGITNQVQVVNTVFSHDQENQDDMVALVGTAVALSLSSIPFNGPVAGARVGYNKENQSYIFNPTKSEMEEVDLDLIVSGTKDSVVMVEAGANEVDESAIVDGMMKAQEVFAQVCTDIQKMANEIGREKVELVEESTQEEKAHQDKLVAALKDKYQAEIEYTVKKQAKLQETGLSKLVEKMTQDLSETVFTNEDEEITESEVKDTVNELMKKETRRMILEDKIRPDGRKPDEIRDIWCEVDVFPRTHGSAMFKRGATQALTVTTLGSPSLGLYSEGMEGEDVRRYIHHYNMPPYAYGDAGRFGWPKRREVGHGALAERALLPMIPSQEEFPYTIRVVSEIMSSNGSTSQASICGSTLSLMSAGVPIKKPVAGIAMGMISEGLDNYQVLFDIQGLEDHIGDMDFKVAGTKDGVTAIQMDIKLEGITVDILTEALAKAKEGRLRILDKMLSCIDQPREQLSQYAPKVEQMTIPADRIGEVIGPGGKIIKEIIELTGAQVDIDEDEEAKVGIVNISSPEQEAIDRAKKMVENIIKVVEVNEEYKGTVTRIEDYGAFVEFLPGREGLVHISQMAADYVKDPRSLVGMGDEIDVRVNEVKDDGKISLSMLSQEEAKAQQEKSKQRRSKGGSNRRSNNRNRR